MKKKYSIMLIPKPIEKKEGSEDHTKEYLDKWKELFEALHPEIKVYLKYKGGHCSNKLNERNSQVVFASDYYDPEIFIDLPYECGMLYLAGLNWDRMFSDVQVSNDGAYFDQDNNQFDCESKTETWEHFYDEIHKVIEENKKRIPVPPQTK